MEKTGETRQGTQRNGKTEGGEKKNERGWQQRKEERK